MSDMSTPVPFLLEVLPWGLRECSLKSLKIECLGLAENAFPRLHQLDLFVFQKKQIALLKTSGHKCIILRKIILQSNEKVFLGQNMKLPVLW